MNNRLSIGLGIILILSGLFLPIDYLLRFFLDDAYFYMKTALNFSRGVGSTFDGMNSTNGYHPLWFLLLSAWYFVIELFGKASPETLLRATFILIVCINTVSLLLVSDIMREFTGKEQKNTIVIFLALIITMPLFLVIGLEQQLLILLFLLYLYYEISGKNNSIFIKPLLLSMIILTRTDMIIYLLPAILFYEYKISPEAKRLTRTIRLSVFPLLTYGGYQLSNYLIFGEFTTVSSKIEFIPGIPLIQYHLPMPLSDPIRFGLLLIFLTGLTGYLLRGRKRLHENSRIQIACLFDALFFFSIVYMLIHYSFNKNGMREWYYSMPVLIALISFVLYMPVKIRPVVSSVIAGGILLFFFVLFRPYYYNTSDAYLYAMEVKRNTTADDRIYMYDYSGLIGFFSERSVINGDGLINSFEFLRIKESGRLSEYLNTVGVNHISTYAYSKPDSAGYIPDDFPHDFPHDGTKFMFNTKNLVVSSEKRHGGFFRTKYGQFYLFRYNGEQNGD